MTMPVDLPLTAFPVAGTMPRDLSSGSPVEALALVNGTDYGLSAAVWSRDVDTCMNTAREGRAGTVGGRTASSVSRGPSSEATA
jgi:betaine-aldehyde dehydrogenase